MFETDEKENTEEIPEEELMYDSSRKKKIVLGAVLGAVVLACIGGFAFYSSNQAKSTETAKVQEIKLDPPEIRVVGEKLVLGINTELEVQNKVVKSIKVDEREGNKIKEVKIEVKNASQKDDVVFGASKVGKEKDGVPPKTIKFTKEGTYAINITAEDTKGGRTVMTVTFEVGAELLSYVEGIKDWTVEVGSKDVDFMKGITYDKERIREVTCDSSKVDLSKEGKYELTYTIKGIVNNQETSIKKSVEVKTISKTEAKEEAEKGNQVVTSNNEVKKDSKGKTPTGEASSNNSNSATSNGGSVEKPSGGSGNGGSSGNKPSGGGDSKPEPEKPSKHEHKWETVNVPEQSHIEHIPAVTEQVWVPNIVTVVDQEAWTETKPVYNYILQTICSYCGANISSNAYQHIEDHAFVDGVAAGYHDDWREVQVGTETINHPAVTHTEDRGHYETKTISEARDEKVIDVPASSYKKCSCGATS